MVLSVKNIRKSSGVSNCLVVDIENTKYILINRTDRIEIYDSELIFFKTIEIGMSISLINVANIDNKDFIIIITASNSHCIIESKFIFDPKIIKQNIKTPLDKQNRICHKGPNESCVFKSSLVLKDVLILFSASGNVLCYSIKNGSLILDDFPNDFKYFKILDVSTDGTYLVFLANDMEGRNTILKYYAENGKLQLKSRHAKVENGQKKIQRDESFLEGVKSVDLYRGGYLSIGKNFVIYEDGETIRTELANTYFKSKCNVGNKMLYSMEDGELIQIEILNKRTNRTRSTQSGGDLDNTIDDLNPISKTEKAVKKIQITVIDKTSIGFDFMKAIDKTKLLVKNDNIVKLIKIENSVIEVINELECNGGMKGGVFYHGKYYLWNKNKIFNLVYCLVPTFKQMSKMNGIVQKFVKLHNMSVIGYYDRGVILNGTNNCILKTERILNISKGIYNGRKKVSFNTLNHIYTIYSETEILHMRVDNIILSSFQNEKAFVFLKDRSLKLIDLNSCTVLSKKNISYEISNITLCGSLLVSTFDNRFIIMDDELNVVQELQAPVFIHSIHFENRIFFSDGLSAYECCINDKIVEFKKVYDSYTPINYFSLLGSSLLVIAEESVILDLDNFTKTKIKLSDITNACLEEDYYFSKGRKIISCDFENSPTYNFFMDKSLPTKRKELFEIVCYFPQSEITIFTDKLSKSTSIFKKNIEISKINNFYTLGGIEYENKLILSGYTKDKCMVILAVEKFKGDILDINEASIIHTEENEILNLVSIRDNLLVFNSNNIFIFNSRFNIMSKIEIDFTIYKIYSYRDYVLVVDYFKSFILLKYTNKTYKLEIVGSPNTACKFDHGALTEKHIILSSGSILYIYEIETFKIAHQIEIGENIVYIGANSLNIDSSGDVYIFTINFSVFCVNLN